MARVRSSLIGYLRVADNTLFDNIFPEKLWWTDGRSLFLQGRVFKYILLFAFGEFLNFCENLFRSVLQRASGMLTQKCLYILLSESYLIKPRIILLLALAFQLPLWCKQFSGIKLSKLFFNKSPVTGSRFNKEIQLRRTRKFFAILIETVSRKKRVSRSACTIIAEAHSPFCQRPYAVVAIFPGNFTKFSKCFKRISIEKHLKSFVKHISGIRGRSCQYLF